MAFDLTGMTNHVTDEAADLRSIAIYSPVTVPLVTVVEGIKYSERLTYFDVDPYFQADSSCATVNPSGDSGNFDQITLTVDSMKVELDWCFKDLDAKSLRRYLRAGAKLDENSAPELVSTIMARTAEQIAKDLESAYWQSSKTQGAGTRNLKHFNGFIQTLETLGGYVNSNTTSETSITVSNVATIFDNHWLAVPAAMKRKEDLITVCGDDTFDKLIIKIKNENYFHYSASTADIAARRVTLPGTNMVIQAVPGLNSDNDELSGMPALFKNRIFTFYKSNLIIATDQITDANDWMAWYEKKDDKLYARVRMKFTTGVFFPQHVVSFKTA